MTASKNPSVEEIIQSGRHAFIEAAAGSGKTTLLTAIFREIIASGKAAVAEILCVTFTEKAASELKAKIFRTLSENADNEKCRRAVGTFSENKIGTIHSFCLNALSHAPAALLTELTTEAGGDDELFEEAREWVYRTCWPKLDKHLLAHVLGEVKFGSGGNNRTFDMELRKRALWCFAMDRTPIIPFVEDVAAVTHAVSFKAWTLLMTVRRMQELAERQNRMTFSRMVTEFARALKDNTFAEKIRRLFRFALIDEFQDTDEVQWQIFRTLFLDTPNAARVIVVGDPKQAIYKFRGADVFVYLKARDLLKKQGAHMAQLQVNFRSSKPLLDFHNFVLQQHEPRDVWKKAQIYYHEPGCARKESSLPATSVEIFISPTFRAELLVEYAAAVAERLTALRREHPEWTFAIIAYRHRSLQIFSQALRNAGIEFSYYNQEPDFHSIEILHLKVLLHSLFLEFDTAKAMAETTLFLKGRPDASSWYKKLYQLARAGQIASLLSAIAQDAHAIHLIIEYGGDSTHFSAWRTLVQTLLSACGKKIYDLDSLLQYLEALQSGDEDNPAAVDLLREPSAVTLLTVQSAKGLDWNVVVIADGHNDRGWNNFAFFHDNKGDAVVPADHEHFVESGNFLLSPDAESRITQLNLLYVALTRAKDYLILFSAPCSRGQAPGPIAYFLFDLAQRELPTGTLPRTLPEITSEAQTATKKSFSSSAPMQIAHGDIPLRYTEHTSATALAERALATRLTDSHLAESYFRDDVLPRGKKTGLLLHYLLEHADLSLLADLNSKYADQIRQKILNSILPENKHDQQLKKLKADRILQILHATATATLPTAHGGSIRLCELSREKIWREMPFWSSAATHEVLRQKKDNIARTMHGYMDMVFTPDDKNYFVLDYKSNSLVDIEPEQIGKYVNEHYLLQAQIYVEALSAYLQTHYAEKKLQVAGCFFVFLRYLKPDSAQGVHFIDAQKLLP